MMLPEKGGMKWSVPLSAVTRPRHRVLRLLLAGVVALIFLSTVRFKFRHHRPNRIQHHFRPDSPSAQADPERLAAVKKEFLHAWTGYKDHAWLSDSLRSLTGNRKDQFCGWAATMIDSLDTLWIMDLKEDFDLAVNSTLRIDFFESAKSCEVNVFESNIRYLGGLLSAYDLSRDQRLLGPINTIGTLLHKAFESDDGMPCGHCKIGWPATTEEDPVTKMRSATPSAHVPLADVGSFYLELTRLSQITGNKTYLDTVKFLSNVFHTFQDQSTVPGLWPEIVNTDGITGPKTSTDVEEFEFGFSSISSVYSLGALSDSAYEYLVKAHIMLGRITHLYAEMWYAARHRIMTMMLFRAYIPEDHQDLLFSGIIVKDTHGDTYQMQARTQHLACFAGGLFAVASRVFDQPEDLKTGAALTRGCVWAYDKTVTGIMPETFTLLACPDPERKLEQCTWNQTLWEDVTTNPDKCAHHNCWMSREYPDGYLASIDEKYLLRPEAIESVFVMYRITGDEYWRDAGWRMFQNIIKATRTPYGHAALSSTMRLYNESVYTTDSCEPRWMMVAQKEDMMESFWLAETLKYFYLLFSNTSLISLDEYVLNTEAHPLRLDRKTRGFPL